MSMADSLYSSFSSLPQLENEDLLITGGKDEEKPHEGGLTRMEPKLEPYRWWNNPMRTVLSEKFENFDGERIVGGLHILICPWLKCLDYTLNYSWETAENLNNFPFKPFHSGGTTCFHLTGWPWLSQRGVSEQHLCSCKSMSMADSLYSSFSSLPQLENEDLLITGGKDEEKEHEGGLTQWKKTTTLFEEFENFVGGLRILTANCLPYPPIPIVWETPENLYNFPFKLLHSGGWSCFHSTDQLWLSERPNISFFNKNHSKPPCSAYVKGKTFGGFTTSDNQHVQPNSGDIEPSNCGDIDGIIEKMLREAGALRARDVFIHDYDHDAVHHCRVGCHKPTENAIITGQREFLVCILLMMAALVAKITYQAAFSLPGGTLKEGYAYNYAANGFLQLKKRDSIVTRSFILFNSSGFVASVAVIISLLHEFPLKPWPQISVCTLFGSYMCLIMATSPREAFALLVLAIPFILLAAAGKLHGFARQRSY